MTTQPLPSPEQIDAMAQELRSDFAIDRLKFANMLDVIASHLRTERQAARDGVTNEIVRIALKAYARARGWSQAMVDSTVDNTRADCFVGMRAALEAIAQQARVPDVKTYGDYEADQGGYIDAYCSGHMDGWNACREAMLKTMAHYTDLNGNKWHTLPQPQQPVPDGWKDEFDRLLEDYVSARAEAAVWNVTQSVQPKEGIRLPKPRLAKLMAHVDKVLSAPSHNGKKEV